MRTLADIADHLDQIAAELRASRAHDWVDASGDDIRSTDQIAHICECSPDTVRRRAEAAAASGHPLGIKVAGIWLLSLNRMFAWLEHNIDKSARLRAEYRAGQNKNAVLRPRPQIETRNLTSVQS